MKISDPDVDWLQRYIGLLILKLLPFCFTTLSVPIDFSAHVTDRGRVFCFNNVVIPGINARLLKNFDQRFPGAGRT